MHHLRKNFQHAKARMRVKMEKQNRRLEEYRNLVNEMGVKSERLNEIHRMQEEIKNKERAQLEELRSKAISELPHGESATSGSHNKRKNRAWHVKQQTQRNEWKTVMQDLGMRTLMQRATPNRGATSSQDIDEGTDVRSTHSEIEPTETVSEKSPSTIRKKNESSHHPTTHSAKRNPTMPGKSIPRTPIQPHTESVPATTQKIVQTTREMRRALFAKRTRSGQPILAHRVERLYDRVLTLPK